MIIQEREEHPPNMIDPPIEDLDMSDEQYVQLLTQGYDPELERQLVAIGELPDKARKMTRFFGLLKGKSPETEEDWEGLIDDWDKIWAEDQISTGQGR